MLFTGVVLAAGYLATGVVQAKQEQYLILAKKAEFSDQFEAAIQAAGGEVRLKMNEIGVAAARSDDPNFATKASLIPELEAVVPDLPLGLVEPMALGAGRSEAPNMALSDANLTCLQWGLDAIHAREAWAVGARGAGARVAVLDGGIDVPHPDLYPNLNMELSLCLVPDETLQYEPIGPIPFAHGSATAGIIGASDDGAGITGVAPEAEIVHVKVSRDRTGSASSSVAIAGLYYAANVSADVANISLAGYRLRSGWVITNPSVPSGFAVGADAIAWEINAWKRAISYAHSKGVTIVACAGNYSINRDQAQDLFVVPGDLPHVIQVSATGPIGWADNPDTDLDLLAPYSNYGQSAIDLAAPGGYSPYPHPLNAYYPFGLSPDTPDWAFDLVLVADHNSGWSWVSGTSFAAPHVAGVAALIIGANGGSMHPDQVRTTLEQSADDLGKPGNDDYYGAGRVNALRAVLR